MQFMAFGKIEALLKMAQFVLFQRNRVQTKSMAGDFYRAFTSQGNGRFAGALGSCATLPCKAREQSKGGAVDHPALLGLTNINNSNYWGRD